MSLNLTQHLVKMLRDFNVPAIMVEIFADEESDPEESAVIVIRGEDNIRQARMLLKDMLGNAIDVEVDN